jgi:GAF domain-containing protein
MAESLGATRATRGGSDDPIQALETLRRFVRGPSNSLGSAAYEISAVLSLIASTTEPQALARLVVGHAVRALGADAGLVGWMSESGRLTSVVSEALDPVSQTPIHFHLMESLAQEAVLNGPMLVEHPLAAARDENVGAHGASMVLPIAGLAGPPAVLLISRASPNAGFTKADVEVANVFAQLISLGVRRSNAAAHREGASAWGGSLAGEMVVVDREGRVLGSDAGVASFIGTEPNRAEAVDITLLAAKDGWMVHEDPSRPGILIYVRADLPPEGIDWRQRSEALERELAAWHTIAQRMLAASGLSEALDDVLVEVVKLTGLPSALIYLYDDASHKLRVAASTGMTTEFVAAVDNIQLGEGFSGRVFLSGEPITTENVSEDWRLSRSIVRAMSLQSYACIPLPGKGRVLGTLGVIGPSRHRFEQHEVEFLVSISRQIGSLLEMAERAYGSWARSQLLHSALPGNNELTDRQTSVIRLLIAGFSPKEIAIRMRISDKTVRNHISHAYARAHVGDRGHLLLWAITHGIVSAGEVPAGHESLPTAPVGSKKLQEPL